MLAGAPSRANLLGALPSLKPNRTPRVCLSRGSRQTDHPRSLTDSTSAQYLASLSISLSSSSAAFCADSLVSSIARMFQPAVTSPSSFSLSFVTLDSACFCDASVPMPTRSRRSWRSVRLAPVGFSFVRSRETRSRANRALLWAVLQLRVSWRSRRVAKPDTYTMLKRASFRASRGSFAAEASSPSSPSSPSPIFASAASSPSSAPSLILSTLRARNPPGYVRLTSEMYSEMFLGLRSASGIGHGRTGQAWDASCMAALVWRWEGRREAGRRRRRVSRR